MNGMFKSSWLNLLFEINHNHCVLIVIVWHKKFHIEGESYQKASNFISFSTA